MRIKIKGSKLYEDDADGVILELPGFKAEYFRSDKPRFETEDGNSRGLTDTEFRDLEDSLEEFSRNVTGRKLAKLIEYR